jgi:hypothetical protein
MKKAITIKYQSGDQATYVAYPPDFAKWELATKKSISDFSGMWDILFVAHSAMKREVAGQPVKPLEAWMESIEDVDVTIDSPKAIAEEVSADS